MRTLRNCIYVAITLAFTAGGLCQQVTAPFADRKSQPVVSDVTVSKAAVTDVHLRPLFTTTIRLPDAVNYGLGRTTRPLLRVPSKRSERSDRFFSIHISLDTREFRSNVGHPRRGNFLHFGRQLLVFFGVIEGRLLTSLRIGVSQSRGGVDRVRRIRQAPILIRCRAMTLHLSSQPSKDRCAKMPICQ